MSRPASDPSIRRVLAALDRSFALDETPTSTMTWTAGHDAADRVIESLIRSGDVSYAGMRAAAVALLRHASRAGLSAALVVADNEQRFADRYEADRNRIRQVAELLGIDEEAAAKVIEQHAKREQVAALDAVH